jgi:Tfp pilus assembly protein PilZ
MNQIPHQERRDTPRIPTNVRCWIERKSVTLYGTVSNISTTGLFFRTPVTVSIGHEVSLSIDLGGTQVDATGHVVWAQLSPCESGQPGLGIIFDRFIKGETNLTRFVDERVE